MSEKTVQQYLNNITRRQLFGFSGKALGAAALSTLLGKEASAGQPDHPIQADEPKRVGGLEGLPHFPAKAT